MFPSTRRAKLNFHLLCLLFFLKRSYHWANIQHVVLLMETQRLLAGFSILTVYGTQGSAIVCVTESL